MMACHRCKKSSSDPSNVLLSCSKCGKNWHHRCHIPPLSDDEVVALLCAENNKDVDNGLSSWIDKRCRRERVRAQGTPEVPIISAPSASVVEVPQPQSLSISAAPEVFADVAPIHDVSHRKPGPSSVPTQSSHCVDQTLLSSGTATSPKLGPGLTADDPGLYNPASSVGSQTTLVQPAVQHVEPRPGSAPLLRDTAAKGGHLLRSTPPTSSARFAPPSFGNEPSTFAPYSRPAHLRESSLALEMSTGQLVAPTQTQVPTRFPDRSSSNLTSKGIDPPMLDLRALSLNRAPGPSKPPPRLLFHRATIPRSPSPVRPLPPVEYEDAEMEDLYTPPVRLPTPRAPTFPSPRVPPGRPSPSLQYPEGTEPPVLPVLAANDPHVLAVLERHEQREAARPRLGTRKPQAVCGAGKKRGRFTFVANRTEAEAARAKQVSRPTHVV